MKKENKIIAQERRRKIFEIIESSGVVSVRDLAQRFTVSSITVVRDLQELEEQGLIRRVHGGAISLRGASYEPPFSAREAEHAEEKRRIAARAVELVNDGESLILDVGTTTLEIARALKGKRNLTVLVTNLRAALELANQSAIQVIVVGGKLRPSELSLVGHLAERTLRSFQVDKAFIAVGGITIEHGLTEFNFEEAGTKQAMIERARRRIVVADHSKFGKVMLTTVAPLNAIDTIITDSGLDSETLTRLRELGIEVVLA
ncbi:DeoR/GlpR family DNA-binding transcription regulator [Thermogemmatispora tikiterensis]|uniref:DeoR/GlpR family DNA-binding transcription regulator n=1 Tax=Thermogemmatispora tikiterensis TaxID=1825093 RepID=UPI000DD62192|nr:DeoR/GlpR family DNA-binding transcription regulator [Thermogemmatispora tikiterensis]